MWADSAGNDYRSRSSQRCASTFAYVIPRPGTAPTEEEIIAFCRERLANFKVPRAVRIVGDLPRNAAGKVLKFALRDEARPKP